MNFLRYLNLLFDYQIKYMYTILDLWSHEIVLKLGVVKQFSFYVFLRNLFQN